jgi:hypothetical protein
MSILPLQHFELLAVHKALPEKVPTAKREAKGLVETGQVPVEHESETMTESARSNAPCF